MWPPGHLATGYLLFTGITRLLHRSSPKETSVLLLAVGTQFPDLIDKSIAYSLGILPEGRSLAHSLLFAIPLCTALVYFGYQRGYQQYSLVFALGYFSHLLGDVLLPLIRGRFSELTVLFWPILQTPDYPSQSFTPHVQYWTAEFQRFSLHVLLTEWQHNFFVAQQWITLIAVLAWIVDGKPGLGLLRRAIRNRINRCFS